MPRPPHQPDHRIGDAERQQAIDVLRGHTGAGRLTLDEFSDLAGEVYAAQTFADLEEVGRKLPPGLLPDPSAAPATPVDAAPAAPPGPCLASDRSRRQRFIGVMSGGGARGRWRPAADVRAFAFWGGVHLDFRYADVAGPVDVTAWSIMGGVTIIVAEGTRVDLDGCVVMGGSSNATRNVEPDPDAPTIRVHARGMWGGVTVVSRKTTRPAPGRRRGHRRRSGRRPAGARPARAAPAHPRRRGRAPSPALLAGPPPVRAHRHRHRHGPGSVPPGVPTPPPSRRGRAVRGPRPGSNGSTDEPSAAAPAAR